MNKIIYKYLNNRHSVNNNKNENYKLLFIGKAMHLTEIKIKTFVIKYCKNPVKIVFQFFKIGSVLSTKGSNQLNPNSVYQLIVQDIMPVILV